MTLVERDVLFCFHFSKLHYWICTVCVSSVLPWWAQCHCPGLQSQNPGHLLHTKDKTQSLTHEATDILSFTLVAYRLDPYLQRQYLKFVLCVTTIRQRKTMDHDTDRYTVWSGRSRRPREAWGARSTNSLVSLLGKRVWGKLYFMIFPTLKYLFLQSTAQNCFGRQQSLYKEE